MKKVLALLGVGALLALGAIAAPALAATSGGCVTTNHVSVGTWSNASAANPAVSTSGTIALTANGVRIVTPDADGKAYGYLPLDPALPLADVTAFYFNSLRNVATGVEPSGQFGFDADGNGTWDGTLAWETVYQTGFAASAVGTAVDYQMASNASVWWVSKTVGTLPAHTTKTWAELKVLFPAAKLQYYGLNLGAGNAGADFTVNNLVLKSGECHRKDRWALPVVVVPSATPTPTPTVNPVATTPAATQPPTTPATSAPAETTAPAATTSTTNTQAAVVPISEETSLPVTGSRAATWFGVSGGLLLLLGTGMLLWYRRRVQYQE